MRRSLLFVCAVLLTTSCGGQKNGKTAGTDAVTDTTRIHVREYDIPTIPVTIVDPEARMRWIVEHYWDNFDFSDTLDIENWTDYADQAFVNFNYHLLDNIPYDMGGEAVAVLFRKAAANRDVFDKFAGIAEKNLFDSESPWRDEELYIAALNAVLSNPALDQWERIRPGEQLRLALKNRVGNRAADFRYTLENGATGTLYALKAPYTLLFFNNPGCSGCREMMERMTGSPYLSRLVEEGILAVLAIYPDADIAGWRDYAPNMPEGWINSYDATQKIENDELYHLSAIPTLYLLDGDKRVMLKDVMSIPLIEQTINNSQQEQ